MGSRPSIHDPTQELEHGDWREKLAADYRKPTMKITLLEAASIGTLSGTVVLGIVGGFYLWPLGIVLRRAEREAKGEFEDEAIGEWKDSNN